MPVFHKYPQCHHIMVNGALCGSPAMKGKRFCYYHYYTPKPHHTLAIPLLDEGRALQVTVAGVLEGIQNKSLDSKQAYLMLYGLHIAVKNLSNCKLPPDWRDMARQDPEPDFDAQLEVIEKNNYLDPDSLARLKAAMAERKKEREEREAQEAQERSAAQ